MIFSWMPCSPADFYFGAPDSNVQAEKNNRFVPVCTSPKRQRLNLAVAAVCDRRKTALIERRYNPNFEIKTLPLKRQCPNYRSAAL
jgi:hypothetical protein